MSQVWPIFKREFAAYFATPLAYVFIVIFLFAMGAFTFYIGRFYDNGIADLTVFFGYHPWLYLFLVPAIAMRLWAEERRTGTIELLLTLPVPLWATVVGGFLGFLALQAGWMVTEFGRQPWVVRGYLRTSEGVTERDGIQAFFVIFIVLYAVLAVALVGVLLRWQRRGSPGSGGRRVSEPGRGGTSHVA